MADGKYLVTGACGFTGSHIVDILNERGLDYRATDLPNMDRKHLPPRTEFVPSDVTDPESLRKVMEGVSWVLHPAAIFDWWAPKEKLYAVNVQGMENVCKAASEMGVKRLISWSTSGVYGGQKFGNLPICENFPTAPEDDYSKSKHEQDKIACRYCAEGKLETAVIRPGIVYGPRAKYGAMQMFEAVSLLPLLPVPINWTDRLGVVHVRDIAGAGIHVATNPKAAGEIFGVVDCSQVTQAEFFAKLAKAYGIPTIPVFAPISIVKPAGIATAKMLAWLARNYTHKRPLFEKEPVELFGVDLWISNQKLLDTGYKFEYPTPDRGIEETVAWLRKEGRTGMSLVRSLADLLIPAA